jgi:hypothetical protein
MPVHTLDSHASPSTSKPLDHRTQILGSSHLKRTQPRFSSFCRIIRKKKSFNPSLKDLHQEKSQTNKFKFNSINKHILQHNLHKHKRSTEIRSHECFSNAYLAPTSTN